MMASGNSILPSLTTTPRYQVLRAFDRPNTSELGHCRLMRLDAKPSRTRPPPTFGRLRRTEHRSTLCVDRALQPATISQVRITRFTTEHYRRLRVASPLPLPQIHREPRIARKRNVHSRASVYPRHRRFPRSSAMTQKFYTNVEWSFRHRTMQKQRR